ncbi:RWD-domain-containing protein [Pleomassaria siparia CBS 279.74]|uniref:RBR-type E3 ubiquitin transferase n=1 Tax=Pleomassaria siparia CBS 279.74 TaxID=1314801 RepID=A0A6G1KEE4_9PLEO|nr:RWD-domain-containing protein [Pleomassaria siparia CBS 279.74]
MADDAPEDGREEELDTLNSIYPELTRNLDNPLAAHIDLDVAPLKSIPVIFEPEQTVYKLSHLPSLHLELILPEGYPTERPPMVKLTTTPPWLPDTVLERLRKEAQEMWDEYGDMPMLFSYISQLQEAAETAFGLADSSDGPVKLASPLKTSMLDFNTRTKRETFEKETFDCGVCLEPKKGAVCYRLDHCSHVFCVACLQDFYNNCIKEGDVNNVKCLAPECGKTGNVALDRGKKPRLISPKELLQIPLTLENVQRFAELKRKKKIEADPSIAFCPRSWCQGAMRTEKYPKITDVSQMDESDSEDEEKAADVLPDAEAIESGIAKRPMGHKGMDRLVICEDCNLAFCRTCLASWHGDFVACQSRVASELTEDDQASLNYILKHTSPCPECSVPCQKAFGCNHMTCFQCKTHFCYLCGSWLPPDNPYGHFNDKKRKACYQRLMDMAEGDEGAGGGDFGGRRGAEHLADFYEQEALRLQMEEDARGEGAR